MKHPRYDLFNPNPQRDLFGALPAQIKPATFAPYRPSNATEGDAFMAEWCTVCQNGPAPRCAIVGLTMAHRTEDADYPREWVRAPGGPRCTAFKINPPPAPEPAERRENVVAFRSQRS